ncbi:MAG: hypothetical protein AAFR93_05325 [Pseudomonadota bacterium]
MLTPKHLAKIRSFFQDEEGAVTVDWVVLTAMVVVLAVIVLPIITPALGGMATGIKDVIVSATIKFGT